MSDIKRRDSSEIRRRNISRPTSLESLAKATRKLAGGKRREEYNLSNEAERAEAQIHATADLIDAYGIVDRSARRKAKAHLRLSIAQTILASAAVYIALIAIPVPYLWMKILLPFILGWFFIDLVKALYQMSKED